jgi:small subunit ribosomal protein S17
VPDGTSGPEASGSPADATETAADTVANAAGVENTGTKRAHRSQKVGAVVSDKMQKTVVVRVDRLVRHMKYRRYVKRTSKFMAHDELGATIGDKVRIVETRPMSARKRWRVIEIVQKAAK